MNELIGVVNFRIPIFIFHKFILTCQLFYMQQRVLVGCKSVNKVFSRSYAKENLFKEIVLPEVKWKKRWEEVQGKIKDQAAVAVEAGISPPTINWFPGHMYKASKQMEEMLSTKEISLVLEIRDARVC